MIKMEIINSLNISSARDAVYEDLKKKILSGQFLAGTHLSERVIAKAYGVSATPIKEAFRRLEHEGLVITEARRGSFVSSQIMKSLEEITLVRSSLEGVSARFAATKITKEEIEELGRIIEEMRIATEQKDSSLLLKINPKFHEHIRSAARNDYLTKQIELIHSYDETLREKALVEDELERAFSDHELIYKKIINRDSIGAEDSMIKHIRRTLSFVKEMESESIKQIKGEK